MKTSKIFVCCHKQSNSIRKNNLYEPIQVGHKNSKIDLGFLTDDKGDNISELNGQYCEMTAVYWAWKNLKNVDYFGIAHYRRYYDNTVTSNNIERWLSSKYDIICCEPISGLQTNYISLSYWITPENSYILFDCILELYPEYHDSINKYFFDSNIWYHCNMNIMAWENFQKYSEWLFPILELLYKRIIPSGYSRINRSIGYAAEALMGLYIIHNNLRVKEVKMFNSETNQIIQINHFWENFGFNISKGIKNFLKVILDRPRPPRPIEISPAVELGLKNNDIELKSIKQSNKRLINS